MQVRYQAYVDLTLINGKIYTFYGGRLGKFEAVAIKDGKISQIGKNEQIAKLRSKRTIDLRGKTATPGFIDSHAHISWLGDKILTLDLTVVRSFDELIEKVSNCLKNAKPNEWTTGRGWNHELWSPQELPTHHNLSKITPSNPIWLRRVDGHCALANQRAMEIAGIKRETPDPPGGIIMKDARENPTGIFLDKAMEFVEKVVPAYTVEDFKRLMLVAQEECLKHGLVEVHDASTTEPELKALLELEKEERLKIKVYALIKGSEDWTLNYVKNHMPYFGKKLTIRAVKLFADGALGSRGALLLEPYDDRPSWEDNRPYYGLQLTSKEQIKNITVEALKRGYQVCVHAIGDRANREALDAFEEALQAVPKSDHRLRIEHAQVVHPDDIPRFSRMGVIASMQTKHATSDMAFAEKRLGHQRVRGAYAWRKILNAGARIAGGSDFPVESENPLLGFYAAITRQDAEGNPDGGWYPEEKLIREEALRIFTVDAAFCAFEEKTTGTLEEGKDANLVVLSDDIIQIEPSQILKTNVQMTIISGEVVWQK